MNAPHLGLMGDGSLGQTYLGLFVKGFLGVDTFGIPALLLPQRYFSGFSVAHENECSKFRQVEIVVAMQMLSTV